LGSKEFREEELKRRPKGDRRKARMAWQLRKETPMSWQWIAQRLKWDIGAQHTMRYISHLRPLSCALATSEKLVWAGWRNIGKRSFADYGRLLVEEKFGEIASLTQIKS
jgi:hypothetical protein